MKNKNINWDTYIKDCTLLIDKIKEKVSVLDFPDAIVAIARGGLIPAQIVSYALNILRIYTIGISTYDNTEQQKDTIMYQPLDGSVQNINVLVIDDIADSGKTFAFVENELKKRGCKDVHTASIYYKPCSKFKPEYYVREISADVWVKFPYDGE